MKFAFLTLGYHPDLAGGAYRYAAEIAERLAARGHEVVVICPAPRADLPADETRAGVRLLRFPNAEGFFAANWYRENRQAVKRLASLRWNRGEPAMACLHHAFFEPCLGRSRLPEAFLFHGPWHLEYRFARSGTTRGAGGRILDRTIIYAMRMMERRVARRVKQILTVSRYSASRLGEWFGAGLAPVRVISGGADLNVFQPPSDRQKLRRDLGLADLDSLLLSVRRLDPRMGLLALVEAFATVAPAFPSAKLWLAGRGAQESELTHRIQESRLAARVRLLGFVPEQDLPGLYAAADCTLMPSLDLECFGLATAESLACGTPVLGSRSGATPEVLSPLGEELLFEAGSVPALAEKLRQVLSGELVLPSRQTCRTYAMESFRWDRPVEALEQTCAELSRTQPQF